MQGKLHNFYNQLILGFFSGWKAIIIFTLVLFLVVLPGSGWGQQLNSNIVSADAIQLSSSTPAFRKVTKPSESQNQTDFQKELWINEPFGERDGSKELVGRRDAFSKHFQNDDGTITAHIASGPIHYQENGQWKTIYHTIESAPNGGFQNIHNSFKTYYPVAANGEIVTFLPDGSEMRDMQDMRMYYEVNGQEVGAMNIANTSGSVDFNELTYLGVYGAHIDLRLTQNSTQRKMDYLLQNQSALNGAPQNAQYLVFEEKVVLLNGTTASLKENTIVLTNTKGELIAEYTNPDIYDEQPSETEDEDYEHRSEAMYQIEQNGNVLTIKTKVQMTWLLDANRNFPVVVDPTIDILVSVAQWRHTQRVYDGGCGNGWVPGVGRTSLNCGYNGLQFNRSSLRFPTGAIPSGSQINSVNLWIYQWQVSGFGGNRSVNFKRLTTDPISWGTWTDVFNDVGAAQSYVSSQAGAWNTGSTWRNISLGATASSDLQQNINTGWFAVGMDYGGGYNNSSNRWTTFLGSQYNGRPYIVVDYTDPNCVAPTITASATSICVDDVVTFTGSSEPVYGNNSIYGYYWFVSQDNINWDLLAEGTNLINLDITFDVPAGTYYIARDHFDICGSYQESNVITVTATPTAIAGTVSAGTTPQCEGSTTTYIVSGVELGGGTGAWSSDNTSVATVNSSTGVVTAVGAGTCSIIYTVTGGCGGTKTANASYSVDASPFAANAGEDKPACINNSATLSASNPPVGNGTWTWSPSAPSYAGGTSASDYNAQVVFNAVGQYTGTWTVTNGACTSSADNAVVTVSSANNNASLFSSAGAAAETVSAIEMCEEGGWTYYAASGTPDEYLFAINKNGNTFSAVVSITDLPGTTAISSLGGAPAIRGTWLIGRYWNVSLLSGSLSTTVDVRFFVDPAEVTQAQSEATAFLNNTAAATNMTALTFFKTVSTAFDPATSLVNGEFTFAPAYLPYTTNTLNGVTYYELTGLTSFSGGTGGFSVNDSGSPLPVELLGFEVSARDNQYIRLDWATATEINNEGFEVLRSTDGVNFERIAWIDGNGNSTEINEYVFNDRGVDKGTTYYYQLKQIDYDGQYEYFDIKSARLDGSTTFSVGALVPNPSKGNDIVSVDVETSSGELLTVEIYDRIGTKVKSMDYVLFTAENALDINISELAEGTYFLNFASSMGTETKKLVVLK